MPIKIMDADAYPGKPPRNIGKNNVCVYQLIGRKCFELLRFKTSANSIYYMVPKLENGTHISFHPKKTHMKMNGEYMDVNIDSFYAANKLFMTLRSPCFCIRIGRNIAADDLDLILPILIKFLPELDANKKETKNTLLDKRFFRFRHPNFKPFLLIRFLNRCWKEIKVILKNKKT